jgi:hypothetical protein
MHFFKTSSFFLAAIKWGLKLPLDFVTQVTKSQERINYLSNGTSG